MHIGLHALCTEGQKTQGTLQVDGDVVTAGEIIFRREGPETVIFHQMLVMLDLNAVFLMLCRFYSNGSFAEACMRKSAGCVNADTLREMFIYV